MPELKQLALHRLGLSEREVQRVAAPAHQDPPPGVVAPVVARGLNANQAQDHGTASFSTILSLRMMEMSQSVPSISMIEPSTSRSSEPV